MALLPTFSRCARPNECGVSDIPANSSDTGFQNRLRGSDPTRPDIVESLRSGGEGACLHPVETAEAAIEHRRRGVPEIPCGVGVGADEGDLLQGHAANIEPPGVLAEADMDMTPPGRARADASA